MGKKDRVNESYEHSILHISPKPLPIQPKPRKALRCCSLAEVRDSREKDDCRVQGVHSPGGLDWRLGGAPRELHTVDSISEPNHSCIRCKL